MKTQLNNRTLWFDGTSQVDPELVPELLLEGVKPENIAVNSVNEDIELFNSLADEPLEFGKVKNRALDLQYKIPARYMKMNLEREIQEQLIDFFTINSRMTAEQVDAYKARAAAELKEIQLRGMEPLVKTLIYVVDTFRETNTVWGVGRGSSCASLILFLFGLHKVDPIKYDIPMTEFFHD